jgi:hypothetical protein
VKNVRAGAIALLVLLAGLWAGHNLITPSLARFTDQQVNGSNGLTADTLDAPTSLSTTCGATSAGLSWTATTDTYAAGNRIERGTASGGPYSQIGQITPRTNVTYTDSPSAGAYYYVVRSYFQNWESGNSNQVRALIGGSLKIHSNSTMSTTSSTASNLSINHATTAYLTASSGWTAASNDCDWTFILVLKDKPDTASSATVDIWWRNGGACSTGTVAGQIFASGTINVPAAVDKQGVTFTVTKTSGSVFHTFVSGDLLCLRFVNNGIAGANDIHTYADTASTSGTSGVSRLEGSFY